MGVLRSAVACLTILCMLAASCEAKPKYIDRPCIGIRLGATYSVVSVWDHGTVKVLTDEHGSRLTPSVVSFTEAGPLVGQDAKNRLSTHPEHTVTGIKRIIGRFYNDTTVQRDRPRFGFHLIDSDGKPKIEVTINGETKIFTPEEITALQLDHMRNIAQKYLNTKVRNAVVTVPAYYTDVQRKSIDDAGTIARVNVVRVINEATAAAIAYGLNQKDQEKRVLVFHMGARALDVTLMNSDDEGSFEVVSNYASLQRGGSEFDERLLDYFLGIISRTKSVDLRAAHPAALERLRAAAEQAKRALSQKKETTVSVKNLLEGYHFSEKITRSKFEELNEDLLKSAVNTVRKVLEDAKVKPDEVDEVVISGGSMRMPKLQQLLRDVFGGKELNKNIGADEVVAYGAAVLGSALTGESRKQLDEHDEL